MAGPLKLEQFGGQLPAWDDRLLPAGQAAASNNAYLFSGALTGWRKPKPLRSTTGKFVYRVPVITKATATGRLVFFDTPGEGDTFVIGEVTYTFTATVTDAFDILIGGDAATSADNALAAIVIGVGVGTVFGEGTCKNPALSVIDGANRRDTVTISAVDYPYILLVAPDDGAAPNSTICTATGNISSMNLDFTGPVSTFLGGINPTFDNNITGDSKWLDFDDPDTSVMRSAVVNDRFGRYYFSSPSLPPKYNTYDRIQNDDDAFLLGLNPPGCAPVVTVTGGGDAVQMGFPTSTSVVPLTFGANTVYLIQITPTAAIELEDVAFMPAETNATAEFAAVLYDDSAGAPFELLNVGNIITGCTAATQVTSQFQNPTGLLAGVKYWVGIMASAIVLAAKADDVTTKGVVFTNTFSNGPPTFAGTPTTDVPTMQIWADLQTGAVIAARSYVYTWVSAYGEESAPSPYTLVNGWNNGTWTIGLWTPPPDDMGVLRNITKLRLYRTITSTQGTAVFFFVAEVPIGTLEYVDKALDSIVGLNNILPSTTWFPPPESLQNIVSMPNGMSVGFRGNEIWFAEPYQPHAWPPGYVLTTEFPIIGLGITGNAVVAVTSGTPYIAQGVNPASMALTKTTKPEPCVSRASVLADTAGVYYISPNGLILVTQYGEVSNTTELWITREKWRKLTPSSKQRAILMASGYFCFKCRGDENSDDKQGFYIELNQADAQSFTIWPQPGGHRIGFGQLAEPDGDAIDNVLVDPWTGIGLLIQAGTVNYYDFSDTTPEILPYKWRSKVYQQNTKKNFGAMKIYFKIPPGTPTQNPVRNEEDTDDASWNTLATDQYGIVRVFADDTLVTTREIRKSGELLRILDGFKAESWQWEFEGRVEITNMQAAATVKELAAV